MGALPESDCTHLRMRILLLLFYFLTSINARHPLINEEEALKFRGEPTLDIIVSQDPKLIKLGAPITLKCCIRHDQGRVWWTRDGKNLTAIGASPDIAILEIKMDSENDTGTYICRAETSTGDTISGKIYLGVAGYAKVTASQLIIRVELGEVATLPCRVQGYPLSNFTWTRTSHRSSQKNRDLKSLSNVSVLNETDVTMTLHIPNVTREDRGLYSCSAYHHSVPISDRILLVVNKVPKVNVHSVVPYGTRSIHLEWDIVGGSGLIEKYFIAYVENNTEAIEYVMEPRLEHSPAQYSYTLTGLKPGTAYLVGLIAQNSAGNSSLGLYPDWVTTMPEDPDYTPIVTVVETSRDSITLRWSEPPLTLQSYKFKYLVIAYMAILPFDRNFVNESDKPYYVCRNLIPETSYNLYVVVCSYYSTECFRRSEEHEVITIDRDPEFIPTIWVKERTWNSISIEWSMPPPELEDRVHQYKVMAAHRDGRIGPVYLNKSVNSYAFQNLTSKTSYWLKVAACSDLETQCGNWSSMEDVFLREDEARDVIWPVFSVIVILLIILVIWMIIQKRREMASRKKFIEETLERFNAGAMDCLDPKLNVGDQAELLPYNNKWEFPRELLKLDKILGSGAFGIVRKAQAKSICRPDKVTTVAVKMVRATHALNYMTALSRELKILTYLGKHLNIVNLLGACTQNVSYGQLLVIVEFCRFGNMRDYLIRRRTDFVNQLDTAPENIAESSTTAEGVNVDESSENTLVSESGSVREVRPGSTDSTDTSVVVDDSVPGTDAVEPEVRSKYHGDFEDLDLEPIGTGDLLSWAWQVSRGMKYLGSRRILHGDLAARNILLADNNVVKICDFGLAKTLYTEENYKEEGHGPLPVKWMAIESLKDRMFSVKSDIWSYGIVLWEFFSLGATPYPGIGARNVYQKLADGYRMARPKYASEDVYQMMLACWDADPSKRPPFDKLEYSIADLLDESVKTHYLDLSSPYVQMNAEALASGEEDYLAMSPPEDTSDTVEETAL